MYSLLPVCLFPFFSILLHITEVETSVLQSIINDLTEFNISCTDDNCQDVAEDPLSTRACHCGIHCPQLGTCCFDSPYAGVPIPELKPTCRHVHNSGHYFLVDQCSSTDSVWAGLCKGELGDQEDVQNIVPVTSLSTSITYKNYYCYKCNEADDEFLYWTLEVKSRNTLPTTSGGESQLAEIVSLTYNKSGDTIMASYYGYSKGYFSVKSSLKLPSETKITIHTCKPDIVSDCPDAWSDDEIRNKCLAYMSLKKVKARDGSTTKYRNIHCALCNYENLTDVQCTTALRFVSSNRHGGGHFGGNREEDSGGYPVFDPRLIINFTQHQRRGCSGCLYDGFKFTYLLDINRSDGERVGKFQRCPDDYMWDRFAKKCRKLACAIPGYKVKNWKCVKE